MPSNMLSSATDIAAIDIDLRELHLFLSSQQASHVEGGMGKFTIREGVLPNGSFEIAAILASAGIQRYIEDVFLLASSLLLQIGTDKEVAYKKTFDRWGNPDPKNIERLFDRIGIFACMSLLPEPEPHRRALNLVNERRNKAAHGKLREDFAATSGERTSWSQRAATPDDRNSKTAIEQLAQTLKEFSQGFSQAISTAVAERLQARGQGSPKGGEATPG